MLQNDTNVTNTVRLNKDIIERVKMVSRQKGQTISGYITTTIMKQLDRDWLKFSSNDKKGSI
jgi:predicted DNA-binding protein